jgi:polygalacturonase
MLSVLSHRMIIRIYLVLIPLSLFMVCDLAGGNDKEDISKYLSNLPFNMPKVELPQFPDYSVNIEAFGAVGDGHTLNTKAISRAITDCAEAGGGKVIVPSGIWFTGPIILKNNVNLHVEDGAVVIFSGNFEDYPVIQTSWEGSPMKRCVSPIYGKDLINIAITGKGIFDGSGNKWRPVLKNKMSELEWNSLVKTGGVLKDGKEIPWWWPSEAAANGESLVEHLDSKADSKIEDYAAAREYLRPVLVSLVNCQRILLDGPTFQNSPAWNIHPLLCENVVIRNIKVRNPWYSTNGDGLDLESCRNVIVYKCNFDVGDDALCLKSGRNEYGRERGIPTENIVISDCIVYHGHGGFVIGSEMSGGVRNVAVQNCIFLGTDLGLRFKSTRGRGGVVENIIINNILMENILTDAIRFNMFYQGLAPSANQKVMDISDVDIPPVTAETPQFRNIYINDVLCRGANRAVFLQGLPEMPIKNIEIKYVKISAKGGLIAVDAEGLNLSDVTIIPEQGPVLELFNSKKVQIENVKLTNTISTFLKLVGNKTQSIELINYDMNKLKKYIDIDKTVNQNALINK